jgi:hypothetical protein
LWSEWTVIERYGLSFHPICPPKGERPKSD